MELIVSFSFQRCTLMYLIIGLFLNLYSIETLLMLMYRMSR